MPIGYSPPRQQLPRLHVPNVLARQGRTKVGVVWVVLLKMRKRGKARAYILMGTHTVMVGGMHTRMITAMGSRMKRVLKLSRLPSIGMPPHSCICTIYLHVHTYIVTKRIRDMSLLAVTPCMHLQNTSACTQIHSYSETSRHRCTCCQLNRTVRMRTQRGDIHEHTLTHARTHTYTHTPRTHMHTARVPYDGTCWRCDRA